MADLDDTRRLASRFGTVEGNSITRLEGVPLCWALDAGSPHSELRLVFAGTARSSETLLMAALDEHVFDVMLIAKVLALQHSDGPELVHAPWRGMQGLGRTEPRAAGSYLIAPADRFPALPQAPGLRVAVGLTPEENVLTGIFKDSQTLLREVQGRNPAGRAHPPELGLKVFG